MATVAKRLVAFVHRLWLWLSGVVVAAAALARLAT
jgi:hypothetical protein